MEYPPVTVIIPHWNGEAFLRSCLSSLARTTYPAMAVLVVDNGSTDSSVSMVHHEFPDVKIYQSPVNLGYTGGCNLGIRHSQSPFFVLLNNDTEVAPDWLDAPMRMMAENPNLAGVQPKLRSMLERDRFDYCGGAGGEIDRYGYPFTWGRVFQFIEKDKGQYDRSRPIFWATGAACLVRREATRVAGLLDETFFAHMEEIDLFWRFHLMGYEVAYCPESLVFHYNGGTLGPETLKKMVLNHRNSQVMLLKNYSFRTLVWIYPSRIFLEGLTAAGSVLRGDFKRIWAVVIGFWGVMRLTPSWMRERKRVQSIRKVSDEMIMQKMVRNSVALGYFLQGKKRATDFMS